MGFYFFVLGCIDVFLCVMFILKVRGRYGFSFFIFYIIGRIGSKRDGLFIRLNSENLFSFREIVGIRDIVV